MTLPGSRVAKAWAAGLTALSAWLVTAPSGGVTAEEWGAFAGCAIVAYVTWLTPNAEPGPFD